MKKKIQSNLFLVLCVLAAVSGIAFAAYQTNSSRLINGVPVDPNDKQWHPVVRIKTGSSGCTGTVVGPRVLLTAAHCGNNGDTSVFMGGSTEYRAKLTRHPSYPSSDIDLALGLLDKDWSHSIPATVSTSQIGMGSKSGANSWQRLAIAWP